MNTGHTNDKSESSEFTWHETKARCVIIYWRGREVMVVKGKQANNLAGKLAHANGKQQQMLLAKITGNFKRGNDRGQSVE